MKPSKRLQNILIFVCFIAAAFVLLIYPKSPANVTQPVAASEHKPANANTDLNTICQNLKEDMQQINAQRTTLALKQINQQIQICLPHLNFAEQKQLMQLSDQMYQQFLAVERSPEQQKAFAYYVANQAQYPTIQQNNFEKLHSRDQYLIRHHAQAYIDLVQIDQDHALYRRHPSYLTKIFAPYLPEAESQFISELASQNLQPIWSQDHLNIPANEVVRRALYWQDYLARHKNGSYQQDARYLLNYYSRLLFEGGQDNPIPNQFDGTENIQADMLDEIKHLAQQEQGKLSQQAQAFLRFIALSPEQKQQISTEASPSNHHNAQPKVLSQLEHYLGLQQLPARNCFLDAVCHANFPQLKNTKSTQYLSAQIH